MSEVFKLRYMKGEMLTNDTVWGDVDRWPVNSAKLLIVAQSSDLIVPFINTVDKDNAWRAWEYLLDWLRLVFAYFFWFLSCSLDISCRLGVEVSGWTFFSPLPFL